MKSDAFRRWLLPRRSSLWAPQSPALTTFPFPMHLITDAVSTFSVPSQLPERDTPHSLFSCFGRSFLKNDWLEGLSTTGKQPAMPATQRSTAFPCLRTETLHWASILSCLYSVKQAEQLQSSQREVYCKNFGRRHTLDCIEIE